MTFSTGFLFAVVLVLRESGAIKSREDDKEKQNLSWKNNIEGRLLGLLFASVCR